ncbi:hypothetical protein Pelo_15335, partial [Pelomyxa schiedti]
MYIALFKGCIQPNKNVVFLFCDHTEWKNKDSLHAFVKGIWVEDNSTALNSPSLTWQNSRALYFDKRHCISLLQKKGDSFSWPLCTINGAICRMYLAVLDENCMDTGGRLKSPFKIESSLTKQRLFSENLKESLKYAQWKSRSYTLVDSTCATNIVPLPLNISDTSAPLFQPTSNDTTTSFPNLWPATQNVSPNAANFDKTITPGHLFHSNVNCGTCEPPESAPSDCWNVQSESVDGCGALTGCRGGLNFCTTVYPQCVTALPTPPSTVINQSSHLSALSYGMGRFPQGNCWDIPPGCTKIYPYNYYSVKSWEESPYMILAHAGVSIPQIAYFEIAVNFSYEGGVGVSALGGQSGNSWSCMWEFSGRITRPLVPPRQVKSYNQRDTIKVRINWKEGKIYFESTKKNPTAQLEESPKNLVEPFPTDVGLLFPAVRLHGNGDNATLLKYLPTPINQGQLYQPTNNVNVDSSPSNTFPFSGYIQNNTNSELENLCTMPTYGIQGNQEEASASPASDTQQDGNERKELHDSGGVTLSSGSLTTEEHIEAANTEKSPEFPRPGQGLTDLCTKIEHLEIRSEQSPSVVLADDSPGGRCQPTSEVAPTSTIGGSLCQKLPFNDHCTIESVSNEGGRHYWKLTVKDCNLNDSERHQLVALAPGNALWFLNTIPFDRMTAIINITAMRASVNISSGGRAKSDGDGLTTNLEHFELFSADNTTKICVRFMNEQKETTEHGRTSLFHTAITGTKNAMANVYSNLGLEEAKKLLVSISQHVLLQSTLVEETIFQADIDIRVGLNTGNHNIEFDICTVHVENLCVFDLPM